MVTSGTTCSKSRRRTAEVEAPSTGPPGSGVGNPSEFRDNAILLILEELRGRRLDIDAAVMLFVGRQCSASELHMLDYNRQLHADGSSARGGRAMVADRPAGEAREHRRQIVRHARLRHLPHGEVAVPKELFEQILQLIDGL